MAKLITWFRSKEQMEQEIQHLRTQLEIERSWVRLLRKRGDEWRDDSIAARNRG